MKSNSILIKLMLAMLVSATVWQDVYSQQTPPSQPPQPQRQQPSLPPQGPRIQQGDGDAEEMISVQFPNNTIGEILDLYQNLTQKHLIKDAYLSSSSPTAARPATPGVPVPNAPPQQPNPVAAGPNAIAPTLSIVSVKPMKKSEAIKFIESALILNGYTLVPSGPDSIKVINNASGKNPLQEGIRVYADVASLPSGDQIVSYFMPFKYMEANDMLAIFQQGSLLHTYGRLTSVVGSRAIVITENVSVIRELIKLKELIDVPPARLETKFVQLKRADAERVAQLVTDMLNKSTTTLSSATTRQGGGQQRQGQQNQPRPQMGGGMASSLMSSSSFTEMLAISSVTQVIPDTRMNRVLVVTSPSYFPMVRNLIEELDVPGEEIAPYRRHLNFITASDLLPILSDLLNDDTGATTANKPQQTQQTQNRTTTQQNTNVRTTTSSTTPDLLTAPQVNTAPISVTVKKVRLIADNLANTIIVIGPPESIAKVSTLIDELDQRPKQVYLSALVGSLTVNQGDKYAFDVLQTYQRAGQFGLSSSSQTGANPGTPFPSATGMTATSLIPAASGLTMYGMLANSVNVVASALENTKRFEIISRPSIYTANNKKAVIASGERFAYAASTTSDLSNTTSVQTTAAWMDVALKLEVVPLINSKDEVTLQIGQQNQSVIGSSTVGENTLPTLGTQLLTTTVTVQNKSTIILGGLITSNTSREKSGIPYLMDIPVLGYLFKSDSKSDEKKELVVLIQPTILETDDAASAYSKEEASKSSVGQRYIDNPDLPPAEKVKKKTPASPKKD